MNQERPKLILLKKDDEEEDIPEPKDEISKMESTIQGLEQKIRMMILEKDSLRNKLRSMKLKQQRDETANV